MNNALVRIIMMGLLLMLAIAPLAGLAPIMLFLFVIGFGWMLWSLLQTLFFGTAQDNVQSKSNQREAN